MEVTRLRFARTEAISLAWGCAESIFFFIVPDVWLTHIAITDVRRAFKNCLWAVLGALIGGSCVYAAAQGFFLLVRQWMEVIPAISPSLIDEAGASFKNDSAVTMFVGGLQGIPYKIYALWAGYLSLSYPVFLAITVAARLSRFVIVTTGALLLAHILKRRFSEAVLFKVHIAMWMAFYGLYFWAMA